MIWTIKLFFSLLSFCSSLLRFHSCILVLSLSLSFRPDLAWLGLPRIEHAIMVCVCVFIFTVERRRIGKTFIFYNPTQFVLLTWFRQFRTHARIFATIFDFFSFIWLVLVFRLASTFIICGALFDSVCCFCSYYCYFVSAFMFVCVCVCVWRFFLYYFLLLWRCWWFRNFFFRAFLYWVYVLLFVYGSSTVLSVVAYGMDISNVCRLSILAVIALQQREKKWK